MVSALKRDKVESLDWKLNTQPSRDCELSKGVVNTLQPAQLQPLCTRALPMTEIWRACALR